MAKIELEEGMPASRALRRRARSYLEQAQSLMVGKSGLSKKEQVKLLDKASKATGRALEDLSAAAEARESE